MQEPTYCAYPAEVHKNGEVSTRVRRPRIHIRLKPIRFPWQEERRPWAAMGVLLVGVAAVCVAVGMALPHFSGGHDSLAGIPAVTSGQTEGDADCTPTEETRPSAPSEEETVEESSSLGTEAESEEGVFLDGTAGGGADSSEDSKDSEEGSRGDGTAVLPADTAVPDGKTEGEAEDSAVREPESAEGGSTEPETAESATGEPETAESATGEPEMAESATGEPEMAESVPAESETAAPDGVEIPEGWIPVLSLDMSESSRGAGYITGSVSDLPASLPAGRLWEGTPAVLVVNTHPYEGFSDGSSLYDPASGGLAVTDTPYDPDGVVALGAALTRALRGMGVTVIHLRVPVSAGESAGVICDRTEAMIRYYCRLYPDIGLVLDLRRSAELTAAGEILRTAGCLDGADCGQIRISVNGGKDEAALGWDLTAALALRQALWEVEPTVSRPVRVKSGQGLIPELTGVRVLTVEAGSAGNTYAEAERLVMPLAEAVEKLLGSD